MNTLHKTDAQPVTVGALELNTQLMVGAEWELKSFARAVHELFGPEQALMSVDDWLDELELMEWPGGTELPDWRRLTVGASAKLATRVNGMPRKDTYSRAG